MTQENRVAGEERTDEVQEVRELALTLRGDVDMTMKTVEELRETLYGNGREGLKTVVCRMYERQKLMLWVGGVIAGGVVLSLIGQVAVLAGK